MSTIPCRPVIVQRALVVCQRFDVSGLVVVGSAQVIVDVGLESAITFERLLQERLQQGDDLGGGTANDQEAGLLDQVLDSGAIEGRRLASLLKRRRP